MRVPVLRGKKCAFKAIGDIRVTFGARSRADHKVEECPLTVESNVLALVDELARWGIKPGGFCGYFWLFVIEFPCLEDCVRGNSSCNLRRPVDSL